MDNSDMSKNHRHPEEHLGVNKMGKNIRKSPLHQPSFNNPARQHPQPQVYNISKGDFRNIVQQLTGSPSRDPLPRPPQNPPKPSSMRLQRIRPPPLRPINRPHIPPLAPFPALSMAHVPPPPAPAPASVPYNAMARPPPFGQPSPTVLPLVPGDSASAWGNPVESPISAYMRYLQSSIIDSGPKQMPRGLPQQHQQQPQIQSQASGQTPGQLGSSGLLANLPAAPPLPSPRMNGSATLPSPSSQFLLPSPTGFPNMFSPGSHYPLLSPGYQFPQSNFSFSPMAQPGILGPGPQLPLSPGSFFPLSPSGIFPIPSPRWRNQ